jgi:hypothetical protein
LILAISVSEEDEPVFAAALTEREAVPAAGTVVRSGERVGVSGTGDAPGVGSSCVRLSMGSFMVSGSMREEWESGLTDGLVREQAEWRPRKGHTAVDDRRTPAALPVFEICDILL